MRALGAGGLGFTGEGVEMNESELEKEIVTLAMRRLKSWKKENPKGLIPFGEQGAPHDRYGHRLIEACLELEKMRAVIKETDDV